MNNKRRSELDKALKSIESAIAIVESVKDEEDCVLDNIPENLQESQRYMDIESGIDSLEDAMESLEEAYNNITEAM